MVEEALAVAGVVVVVEDVEEEVVDLEVEADDMTMRKKLFYYLIHIVLTLYYKPWMRIMNYASSTQQQKL